MIFRKLSRIKTRALLLSLVPAAIMALALTIYVIDAQLKDLAELFEERGNAVAQEAAAYSIYGIFSGDREILTSSLQEISRRNDVASIKIVDNRGKTLARLGQTPLLIEATGNGADGRYFSAPVISHVTALNISDYPDQLNSGEDTSDISAIGTAIVVIDDTRYLARERKVIRNSLLIGLAVLLITAFITIYLSRKVTDPLLRLTQAVIRMKHGDFSIQVSEESKGEIRSLEEGFNAMARELQHSQIIMQSQIDQATSDLVQTMEAIEIQNVELDLARKRALKISHEKSEFLATMSHEIRTPMNGVIGFSRLLHKTALSPDQFELVETIEKSAFSLLKIINGILDYSKLEYGKLEPDHTPFNTVRCFEEPLTLLAPAAHDKGLELVLLIYSDVPTDLIGDESRIRQMLVNLIGNAVKFTHQGEVVVRVMLADETNDTCTLQFSVTDTGIGIDPRVQKELFHSFRQGSSSTSKLYGGTGLGLSISRKLAESMNGSIELESEEGQGACFTITLTLAKTSTATQKPEQPLQGKTCLVLDDNRHARLSMKHSLSRLGLEVSEGGLRDDMADSIPKVDLVLLGFSALQVSTGEFKHCLEQVHMRRPQHLLLLLSSSDQKIMQQIRGDWGVQCFSKPQADANLQRIVSAVIADSAPVEMIEPSTFAPPSLVNYRILIADDNGINLQLISTILKSSGAEVIEKKNGLEALEYIKAQPCDLVFMDIHMPIMDGKEATQKIREWEDGSHHIPIIALTADVVSKSSEELFTAGVDRYLTKPIDDIEMWNVICELLYIEPIFKPSPKQQVIEAAPNQEKEFSRLPSRDMEAAMKIVGGREALANEMFDCFLDELPGMLQEIMQHHEAKAWQQLRDTAHRLHGSSAVCGVPRIHAMIAKLEGAAEDQQTEATDRLIDQVTAEVDQLMSLRPH